MFRKLTQVVGFKMPNDITFLHSFMENNDMEEWKMWEDTQYVYLKKEYVYGCTMKEDQV